MGYSYTVKAGYTLDAISRLIGSTTSNGMPDGGFWEHGRQRCDGAIVGIVWQKPHPTALVRKSFHIDPDGKIIRFPGLTAALKRQAEADGEAAYKATHGTWRERGAAFLTGLESGKIDGKLSWSFFESIFSGWQRDKHIMFAAQPKANNAAMAEALRDMLEIVT